MVNQINKMVLLFLLVILVTSCSEVKLQTIGAPSTPEIKETAPAIVQEQQEQIPIINETESNTSQ